MMQELGSSLTRLGQSMQLGRLSKCGDIWKWWWVHCRTRCPIHCKGLLLARGQLASSGRRLWAGQVPFPGENISRLGKGEHWAWQALQGITWIPLPNQPLLRLARSIRMRSTENGPLYSLAYSLSELETLAGVPICVKSRTSFPLYQVREGTSLFTTVRSERAGGFGDASESWI